MNWTLQDNIRIQYFVKFYLRISYELPNSMEQNSSWEANSLSVREEIPRLVWNPRVHYRVHKSPHRSLSWARRIKSTPSHSFSLRSIVMLSSHLPPTFMSGPFPSGFSTKLYVFLCMYKYGRMVEYSQINNVNWVRSCEVVVILLSETTSSVVLNVLYLHDSVRYLSDSGRLHFIIQKILSFLGWNLCGKVILQIKQQSDIFSERLLTLWLAF